MSTTSPTPTTTYPFVFTTYTNPSPSTQFFYPTTYTDTTWLPLVSADTRCSSETAYPRIEGPDGLKAGCVISNAVDINPHAFWDVYDCCPGRDMSAYGYLGSNADPGNPGICMVQCSINESDAVTWQQVGECLQKRVKEVVCKPRHEELPKNQTELSIISEYIKTRSTSATSGSVQASATGAGVGNGTSGTASGTAQSTSAAGSTGAATSLDLVHASTSKVGVFTFFLLAVGSAAGMFL